MDFVKNRVGVEVQFSKYAFYNVCAKMTIFHKQDIVDVGIEIVPVKSFTDETSTSVSYFEQFVCDLEQCGLADIDIPVLILGVTAYKIVKERFAYLWNVTYLPVMAQRLETIYHSCKG